MLISELFGVGGAVPTWKQHPYSHAFFTRSMQNADFYPFKQCGRGGGGGLWVRPSQMIVSATLTLSKEIFNPPENEPSQTENPTSLNPTKWHKCKFHWKICLSKHVKCYHFAPWPPLSNHILLYFNGKVAL